MCRLREYVQSLLECLPGRVQRRLCFVVLGVAVHVQLVTPCAEVLGWEGFGDGSEEVGGEVDGRWLGEAELASGRL